MAHRGVGMVTRNGLGTRSGNRDDIAAGEPGFGVGSVSHRADVTIEKNPRCVVRDMVLGLFDDEVVGVLL